MSDLAALTVTLIGRTSAWRPHLPARPTTRDAAPLSASRVHHRAYGMLGIYLAAHADTGGLALSRGQWVQIIGVVRPISAVALPDDPRLAAAPDCTPLLIEATCLRPLTAHGAPTPPFQMTTPGQVRVVPTPRSDPRRILPLIQRHDAVYWRGPGTTPSVVVAWNTVRGVVTEFAGVRYLRYVLSFRSGEAGTEN